MDSKVTSVKKLKGKPRCRIELDSGVFYIFSIDLVLEYRINQGSELSESILKEIEDKQNLIDIRQCAYNYVSYKSRTEKQVIQRLKDKGFSPELFNVAISFLNQFGLLNDEKYAENFIKNYLLKKPSGKNRLMIELLKKGINKELAETAINKHFPDDSLSLALRSAEKKLRMLKGKDAKKKRSSLIAYLQGKGFEWENIKAAINQLLPED